MKKFLAVLLVLMTALAPIVYAAGTVTSDTTWVTGQNYKVVHVHWATDDFTASPNANIDKFDGILESVMFVPDSGNDDTYSAYLYGVNSGWNYSQSNWSTLSATESKYHEYGSSILPVYEPVRFSLDPLADLDSGDVYFYIRVPK